MPETTLDPHPMIEKFSRLREELATAGPEWLRKARREGHARFVELGLPSSRQEEWKQTNLTPLARHSFVPGDGNAEPAELLRLAARLPAAARLTFVDGRFEARLSEFEGLPAGVRVRPLSAVLLEDPDSIETHLRRRESGPAECFRALNTALGVDGAVVQVDPEITVETPIELQYLVTGSGEPTATHPRTLIVAGRNSRLSVVERYDGPAVGIYWTNSATDVVLDDGAAIDHYRLQFEGPEAYHVASTESRQGRNSRYESHSFQFGGKLVRHDVRAVLDGEGAECTLDGLTLTADEQHVDNHTVIDHARPNCDSRELFKTVLDGKSRSVFKGRIIVRRDAQQTDAKQSNPNLLLSRGALAHSLPQLEIYADDVKCTHGATIGRLDEDAVFYLRSRGIPENEARELLVASFAGEVVDRVSLLPLRAPLAEWVGARLKRRGAES